jgi:hypothetical protein
MAEDDSKPERKEKVLHTRIPESLDSEIKDRANRLGVSVSNLVRNVLQNTFGMVNDIVADSQSIARSARDAAKLRNEAAAAASGEPAPNVLGWQPLTLNVNAVCESCNDILGKGTAAHVSVLDGPGKPTFRCGTCVEEIAK